MGVTTRVKLDKKQKDMQQVNHAARAHALLSASKAERWLHCTPSAVLEDKYGVNTTSEYAQEGTLAHELAELRIRQALGLINDSQYELEYNRIVTNELYKEEMYDYVSVYVDYVLGAYNEQKSSKSFCDLKVEAKLDLSKYVPDAFGTADSVNISDGLMEVIDLKYGKGVPVYAATNGSPNKQLMLYGLGALLAYDTFYNIENVKLTIVQPRTDNISSFIISTEELYHWADTELLEKAKLAYKGLGKQVAGPWCGFCQVKARCKAFAEDSMRLAAYDFAEPCLLTDEEIVEVLAKAPQLASWVKAVEDYAKAEAIHNNKIWPGYKLVEGRSARKWIGDVEKIESTIKAHFPAVSDEDLYETSLKTITAVEKLIGKKNFAEHLGDLVIKPEGAPTLVPDSDKRPALGLQTAVKDFTD